MSRRAAGLNAAGSTRADTTGAPGRNGKANRICPPGIFPAASTTWAQVTTVPAAATNPTPRELPASSRTVANAL